MACDVANSLNDVWFRLGFESQSDLNNSVWITANDLYQFADDAVSKLVWSVGMFKEIDSSVAIANGTGVVAMPAGHVFTVFAYIAWTSGGLQILRLTNVEQLYALDAAWQAKAGSPTRLSMDAGGLGQGGLGIGTLYPSSTAAGTLWIVFQKDPPPIAAGSTVLPVTPLAQDYMTYAMLQTALSKESDYARPEVAAHAGERMKLYEKIFAHYYGPGM